MSASNGSGGGGRLSVGVVGAGFGGVGTAIRLKQAGIEDFTVFERGDSVGGVWRANTYPGAACDVPSHLYSFSFAPGHNWTKRYAPQREILGYLNECVREFGIEPHLRLGTEVDTARFDADAGRWTLTTSDGSSHEFDVLVTACGQLTNPVIPAVPGLHEFEGTMFHSAEWDHDHDLSGERVAVIGTGASAIQFVPAIAPVVGEMTIYQRSAPWVIPKVDRGYPEWEQRLFERFPLRVKASRVGLFSFFEAATYPFTGKLWAFKPFEVLANFERRRVIADPVLREKATPDYKIGCKRILFADGWYQTLVEPHVDLVNGRIERITGTGVVGPDGIERPADTIIFGTGFASHDFVAPMDIHGLDGRRLNETWAHTPEAFLGTTVTGFPNLFILYGPNTNHGSGSVPYTLEAQINYVVDGLNRLEQGPHRYFDLRPEVMDEWRREIAERSAATVWMRGGCDSWYLNAEGVNTNNWPGPWLEFRRRTKRMDPAHYEFVG